MLASFLSVAAAVYIFFKFERHRFRALYAGLICSVLLPLFTAVIYSINLFIGSVGIEGFVSESISLVGHALSAPFFQVMGGEVTPAAVFPGWLILSAAIATGMRVIGSSKAKGRPQQGHS